MLKKIKYSLLTLSLIVLVSATTVYNDKLFEISKNLEIFVSVYKELNTGFADELDPSILMRTAIDAMTNSLDPFTNFISESQAESYRIYDDEKYQGIGARAAIKEKKVFITEVYENGPSFKAGIKPGDELISVDGNYVAEKTLEEIHAIMRGIPGSQISLGIHPYGEKDVKTIVVERGEVNIPNVPYSGFIADNVGYINLTVFTANASVNIANALRDFKTKNPDLAGVVLDLRDNGGGLLHEAVQICNHFIPQNEVVVSTRSKVKENDKVYRTMTSPIDLELPLVILINNKSASASEIVSGVIQDYDRGVIIGQRSYGKGLVQNYKDLPYNARLKLTTSKYYIPSGRCIQGLEYENGIPKNIPDSLRSKFKTQQGRIVLDGGGITPDIMMSERKLSDVTQALVSQHVIFEYVNRYCLGRDSIGDISQFSFDAFDDFVTFVRSQKFSYTTELEQSLINARSVAKKDGNKNMETEIEALIKKLTAGHTTQLTEAREEIIREIEKEIVSRYYYQKGKVQYTLDSDEEIMKAIEILTRPAEYKKILSQN
jgi:carboxyl-terminal processing protease